jgi:hypothetical protein
MARRGISEERRRDIAAQAAVRVISRGLRPLYRVVAAHDGRWAVEWCPWLSVDASDRRGALVAARAAVADWLGVPPDSFDVEVST